MEFLQKLIILGACLMFVLLGVLSFFKYLSDYFLSFQLLSIPITSPEEFYTTFYNPKYKILNIVNSKTPSESKVCFPKDYYDQIFQSNDPQYKFIWFDRVAFKDNDSSCQYKITIEKTNNLLTVGVIKI